MTEKIKSHKKMTKEKLLIIPNPNKILIKIPKASWNSLFSKYVKDKNGKEVELFIDIQEASGYERRFQQNTSIGKVVAVGENITDILPGDMAIIDYTVTGEETHLVGYINEEMYIAIDANTTYHTEDSVPNLNGMNTYQKGDFEEISKLYGIVRDKVAYSRDPYVFLVHENPVKLSVNSLGITEQKIDEICTRTVLASNENSVCKLGDKVVVKESDIFERILPDNHTLSVIFEQDIIAVL